MIWQKFEQGLITNLSTILFILLVGATAFMLGTKIELKQAQPNAPIVIQTTNSPNNIEEIEKTVVSSSTTTETKKTKSNESTNKTNKININTANATQLDSLDGIGPSKAAAIIKFREANGPFKSINDLTKVSGIGEKTFAALKDKITI